MAIVAHMDLAEAPKNIKRTPQGGILADSRPTRCGILNYTYPDGKKLRELRHPDEVFHPDSLATLAGAPVTIAHPKTDGGFVTPKTYRNLGRGHMGEDIRQDGEFVAGTVRIQDEEAAAMVESRQLCEMSCGYLADLDETPGIWNGQQYDAVQRNIRYNHVALLPANRGRAGREVGLRLDGVGYSADMTFAHVDDSTTVVAPAQVLDAKDFVSRSEYDTVKGQLAAAQSQLDAMKVKLDAADQATSPAALDKRVQERTELIAKARALVPAKTEFKTDGLSDIEIMISALKLSDPGVKLDGESADFIRGNFKFAADAAVKVAQAHGSVQSGLKDLGKADGEDKVAAARKRMIDYNNSRFSEGSK